MAYITRSYNFSSKYLLKEAFASIPAKEKLVCFRVLNSNLKCADLTREHPVYSLQTIYCFSVHIPLVNSRKIRVDFHL